MKILLALPLLLIAAPAFAKDKKPAFDWHFDLKSQYVAEDRGQAGTFEGRARLKYRPANNLLAYLDLSAVKSYGGGAFTEDSTGLERPSKDYLELRQAWLRADKVFGTPLQLQLGRQRIREDYALWWNRDLDAVRALYATDAFKGFIGVAQNLASYRTSDDMDDDEKDQFHAMAEASFLLDKNNGIEARALFENDYSGHPETGAVIARNDRDREDGRLGWAGLRYKGEHDALKYRVDGIAMTGRVARTDFAGDTVTGTRGDDVSGFAFDGGADIKLAGEDSPVALFNYAFGSRDFRQSEIFGNATPLGLSTATIHHYGEVLRPGLSNLHILTAGLSVPVLKSGSLTFLYHHFWLADENAPLRSRHPGFALTGRDRHLGQELDAVFDLALDPEIPVLAQLGGDKDFRLSTGVFRAGSAVSPLNDDLFYRALAEFRIRY